MKVKRFDREFVDSIIKEVSETKNVPSKHGIPNSTIHAWIKKNNNPIKFKEKKNM